MCTTEKPWKEVMTAKNPYSGAEINVGVAQPRKEKQRPRRKNLRLHSITTNNRRLKQ